MVMNEVIEPGLKPSLKNLFPHSGDIFVLYCSHCFNVLLLYKEGGDKVFPRSGKKVLSWPYCANVLDLNMPFSERKSTLLKR